jgi:hypothetical protein
MALSCDICWQDDRFGVTILRHESPDDGFVGICHTCVAKIEAERERMRAMDTEHSRECEAKIAEARSKL